MTHDDLLLRVARGEKFGPRSGAKEDVTAWQPEAKALLDLEAQGYIKLAKKRTNQFAERPWYAMHATLTEEGRAEADRILGGG